MLDGYKAGYDAQQDNDIPYIKGKSTAPAPPNRERIEER
jgi:hypothetical protein